MRFEFSDHAKFRLLERGVSTEEVKRTISKPDTAIRRRDGTVVAGKSFGKHKLTVVYVTKGKLHIIVTVIKV